jgi:hypothetical protein
VDEYDRCHLSSPLNSIAAASTLELRRVTKAALHHGIRLITQRWMCMRCSWADSRGRKALSVHIAGCIPVERQPKVKATLHTLMNVENPVRRLTITTARSTHSTIFSPVGWVAAFIGGNGGGSARAAQPARYTAHPIWSESPGTGKDCRIAESTACQHVRLRKQALDLCVAPEPVRATSARLGEARRDPLSRGT